MSAVLQVLLICGNRVKFSSNSYSTPRFRAIVAGATAESPTDKASFNVDLIKMLLRTNYHKFCLDVINFHLIHDHPAFIQFSMAAIDSQSSVAVHPGLNRQI